MKTVITNNRIDIRGLVCPYTFVKAKLAIESLEIGQVLEILLDYEEASISIPKAMKELGHSLVSAEKIGVRDWVLLIRKEKE